VIGRTIDKYRILEEVGQGGMSVVYKGMDTSLNREVAVKVLHPHLAAHQEARQRFKREAHAVAKLRHENILEIFDYSGLESSESYIVTEFIRGRTLRSFVGEHPIGFPEIAAMIVVEVCRALAHAHALGVLHRDIKPENVMIREDGVVKLMDFGIAQIVDTHRMTVTGQLLGSPAYMSPEHVEGRPLDFRTDVFSVGIVLYQLATGELPFKGRNPHEILKRIAECRYLDAHVVNPLVADRLSRIIARALARLPEDRYPDVALLVDDLQRFLADVELGEPRSELVRFFSSPVTYEQALRQRLIATLTRRGQEELDGRRTARALELWNRVLTIDPANDQVLRFVDRLGKRRRVRWGLVAAAALLAASSGVAVAWDHLGPAIAEKPAIADVPADPPPAPAPDPVPAVLVAGGDVDAGPLVAQAEPEPEPEPEQEPTPEPEPAPREPPPTTRTSTSSRQQASAIVAPRTFRLVPTPRNASYSVNGGDFVQVSMGDAVVTLGQGAHQIVFRHPLCADVVERIDATDAGRQITVRLPFKPARVRTVCPRASSISLNGRPADHGAAYDILEFGSSGKVTVEADFLVDGRLEHRAVTVTAGDPLIEVSCDGT
jgi:eukaryotic-like serine/threonine-protein kinase